MAGVAVALAVARGGDAAEDPDAVVPLAPLVVSATRTPQEATMVSSSVSAVRLSSLAAAQVLDLSTALELVPGVSVATSGGTGAPNSVFVRGASSHQVLFFVDGVRMNDRSAAYYNFLGGAELAGLDRLEVLRGPQSTLYGSSALGGVILMETARSPGETSGVISAQAGSFGTFGAHVTGTGASGPVNVSASLSHLHTDNAEPNNAFEQWSGAARLDGRVTSQLQLGATVRTQHGDYQEPGSRFFPFPGTVLSDNTLATAYTEWSAPDSRLVSRLTYGRHARNYTFTDANDADTFGDSHTQNRRDVIDWQTAWKATPAFELVAGANAEWSRYTVDNWRTTDRVLAGYLSATARATASLTMNVGVRHDDFRSVGAATTGRAGLAWIFNERRTKVRTTIGTGFSAPGSDDVAGVPQWGQIGNPDLRPEKSVGWDLGVEQSFAAGRVTTAATFFQNRFRDLFDYDFNPETFAGQIVNRDRAETRGVELAVQARPQERVTLAGSYTWLEAFDRDTQARLIRRPRHTGDLDVRFQATRAVVVGVGAHVVGNRLDSTPEGTQRIEDYSTMRAYVNWAVRADLTLRARIENAWDEAYDDVAGYAALPRAVYGSVDWKF